MKPEKKPLINSIVILIAGVIIAVALNILFIVITQNEVMTTQLLKNEANNLTQDEQIVRSAADLETKYKSEIEKITEVLPTEETLPQFIKTLDEELKVKADDKSFKFTTDKPIKQQDRQFLLLQIFLKTDLKRLLEFLADLEKMPYLTHIDELDVRSPDGFVNVSDVVITLKLYVQSPFNSK